MSRCFPFPPPGYDKKIKIDETDMLAKERRKEKKHKKDRKEKKEKKDKEKKEREERSKEKSKEKKDKKSKHKDKKDQDRDKEKVLSNESKADVQHVHGKGSTYASSSVQNNSNGDFKHIEELARRIRDEEKATGRQSVTKIKITDQRNGEMPGRLEGFNFRVSQGNENGEELKEISGRINGQRNPTVSQTSKNLVSQKFSGEKQKTINGFAKHNWDENYYNKLRDQQEERNSHSEERCIEGKVKELNKASQEWSKLNDGEIRPYGKGTNTLDTRNNKPQDRVMASSKIPSADGNPVKRKPHEINGWLNDNGGKPSKFQRLGSMHTVTEHRRQPGPESTQPASERSNGAASYVHKPEKDQRIINGFINPQWPEVPQPSSSPTTTQVNDRRPANPKPPHPDTEYLTEILSIPKMEDLPGLDDQEWLFGGDHVRLKPPTSSGPDGRAERVWDQAVRIDTADILALPYVIPY